MFEKAILILIALLFMPFSAGNYALGQCEYVNSTGPLSGFSGIQSCAFATTTWDPDGSGPLPELLVIGGDIWGAAHLESFGIAAWNGTSWVRMDRGLSRPEEHRGVHAVCSYNGELYAGGDDFDLGNGVVSSFIRWDGTRWVPAGGGTRGTIHALRVFRGELVAGGQFTASAGISNIGKWNGTTWKNLGAGITATWSGRYLGGVLALYEYGGKLVAGGMFGRAGGQLANRVAAWDGVAWSTFGQGIPGVDSDVGVKCVGEFGGDLVLGGYFYGQGTIPGGLGSGLARWTGSSWVAMGTELLNYNGYFDVNSMINYSGELIVGGSFGLNSASPPPGSTSRGVAAWNGQNWHGLDWGLWQYDLNDYFSAVRAFTVFQNSLIAVGGFSNLGTGPPAYGAAVWNGQSWRSLGTGMWVPQTQVNAIRKIGDEIVLTGVFNLGRGPYINNVLRLVGGGVEALGSTEFLGEGIGLAEWGGAPVFTNGRQVFQWNGATWQQLGSMSGVLDNIKNLTTYNGALYACGAYSPFYGRLVRWNGTNWTVIGYFGLPSLAQGSVDVVVSYRGSLIVGGSFSQCVSRFDGANWSLLSGGVADPPWGYNLGVSSLCVFRDKLIVGGQFSTAGGVAVSNIAQWDGASWSAMRAGQGQPVPSGTVVALAADDNYVWAKFYANGSSFTLQRWDGASWTLVGTYGVSYPTGPSMSLIDGRLYVCGNGISAPGFSRLSWMEFSPDGPSPQITQQPPSPLVCENATVSLRSPAAGNGAISYQWRKNGADITDSSQIFGAQSDTLVFAQAKPTDTAKYSCLVKLNNCTLTRSNTASLTVYPTNSADGNGDTKVNGLDVGAIIDALVNYRPVSPSTCALDLTGDGVLNLSDVEALVSRLLAN